MMLRPIVLSGVVLDMVRAAWNNQDKRQVLGIILKRVFFSGDHLAGKAFSFSVCREEAVIYCILGRMVERAQSFEQLCDLLRDEFVAEVDKLWQVVIVSRE